MTSKYDFKPFKPTGKTLADQPKLTTEQEKDARAANMYGKTTSDQKNTNGPQERISGIERANRDAAKRAEARKWNEQIAASSPEHTRLDRMYPTTPKRNAAPDQAGWRTTQE